MASSMEPSSRTPSSESTFCAYASGSFSWNESIFSSVDPVSEV